MGVGATVGGADDQVALGAGGVLLQRAQQAADVGAALTRASTSAMRASSRSSVARPPRRVPGGLAVDEVADPFDGGAQRAQPRLEVGLRRVEAQPGAQRRGERVGEPAGLGKRDGEGLPARGHRAVAAPAAAGRADVVASSRPQTRVESRSSSVGPTRPESQVATSRSWRSATAFQSAIESSRSPVYAAASGRLECRLVEHVELGLALVAPGAQRLEVAQGLLGEQGLAEPAGRGRCRGAGHRGDHGVRP